MSDWREGVREERPTFSSSALGEDGEAVVQFLSDGSTKETRNGEATVFPVAVQSFSPGDDGGEDMANEAIAEGEEYEMMTGSSRLLYELAEYAENLEGKTVRIEAHGPVQSFDRTYTVESP